MGRTIGSSNRQLQTITPDLEKRVRYWIEQSEDLSLAEIAQSLKVPRYLVSRIHREMKQEHAEKN